MSEFEKLIKILNKSLAIELVPDGYFCKGVYKSTDVVLKLEDGYVHVSITLDRVSQGNFRYPIYSSDSFSFISYNIEKMNIAVLEKGIPLLLDNKRYMADILDLKLPLNTDWRKKLPTPEWR